MISSLIERISKKIGIPRLWDKEEWNTYSAKEKVWIWYKHHWYIRGIGSAEVDQFSNPVKEIVLYGSLVILTVERLYTMAGIEIGATQLLLTVGIICVVVWLANFVLQWVIGNKIDNLDLIALNSEIGSRRQIALRELREAAKNEDWRKAKVN
ncbi:MAG TPA: hypothetical protein ENH95_05940 [Nitrosopumilus sp.]|nr:hypothetical protein [Nitrosopumilus sp.]